MNNPETCQCNRCIEWRKAVMSIYEREGLDYNKITRSDKTDLFNIFVHHSKEHAENNWNIVKSKFKYAKI